MDIRTAPKKVDDSTGFSFLGVDDNELIKINPNDLIKTTSTYAQMRNNDASISPNEDFAEVGRWSDGNPNNEDRLGYFVSVSKTEAGITIVKANTDSCIRGVTTKKPAFAANASLDKYNTDGNLKQEYDYVCFSGFATVIDNGRCTINSQCMPSTDGTAVPSTNSMGYQVIERVDNTKVLILVEPSADMLKRIKDDISELETALESESENRGSAVRAEKEAREAADNTLQTNINAEVTRAKNAESDLSTNINNEVTRAKNAESALSEDLIEEIANVESSLSASISNEVTRAKNAESSLSTTISDEITRAESALNTTISNEVTRAKKAESDLSSSIQTSVSSHNSSTTAHDDIRTLIDNLTARINAVANSEDVDLDQLSEIVAYIKSNRSLIDNVTTSKVSVSDIIDNLTSTSTNKPLSANQGRVLNTSITSLTTKLNNHIDSLSNVENKSSETIRSEITKKNVIDALGYTPGTSSTEPITYTLSKSGSKIVLTSSNGTETSVTDSDTNTTYSAGTGISLSGTTFSNAGVRSISSGSTNGTISVNTNGTSAEVAVKGLGSAAYTASSAYAAASHTHTKSQITDFPTSLPANGGNAATATKLATARTISLTGSVIGSGSFDGSGNLSITTSTNHTHSQYLTSHQDISQVMKNRGIIGNTTDFDTIVDSGCYKVQAGSWGNLDTYHGPNEFKSNIYAYGLMLVIRSYTDDPEKRITQIYFPHSDNDVDNPVVMRMHNGDPESGWWTVWHRFSSYADSATKATQDESGNNIKASYAATMDISGTNLTLKNKNGEALKSVMLSGGSHVGSSAPPDTNILWIDTGNGGIVKYYNGSSWTPIASTWG